MNKKVIIAAVLACVLAGGGYYGWQRGHQADPGTLVLNGNVDIRQVSLAFDGSGRIKTLDAEAGDTVKAGDLLGTLDTESLHLQADAGAAQMQVQQENYDRLKRGARPQEIAQGKSRLAAAQAEAARANNELVRLQAAAGDTQGRAVSKQELDAAKSAAKAANAQVAEQQQALSLLQEGSRKEDVAAARAQVEASKAQLDVLQYQISQGELRAPSDGVIRSRLLEPGDMASPQKAVFAIALTQPKWVRVYVAEPDLSKVAPGMSASVTTDSAPNRPIAGKVGYIASVAEFTPKTVQTEDLRTSLVYEVRVHVDDPQNALRLGQPATVKLDLHAQQ